MEGFGNDTFELSPRIGTGSVVLSLSVKKEANLDYEKEQYKRLELSVSIPVFTSGSVLEVHPTLYWVFTLNYFPNYEITPESVQ